MPNQGIYSAELINALLREEIYAHTRGECRKHRLTEFVHVCRNGKKVTVCKACELERYLFEDGNG